MSEKASTSSTNMRAVVVDNKAPSKLVIREVAVPQPAPPEALVRVAAVSLNRGETRQALNEAQDGWRPGWDFAGVVERAAADRSGPPAGTRVVGIVAGGAWAELVSALTISLAPIPDAVSFAQASTLPVAGLTAWHALAKGGELRGKPVLIGGASGGVGAFACQLAKLAGAHVVAAIRDPRHEAFVRRLGADAVALGADLSAAVAQGPYHLILESVGGRSLGAALGMLAPGGTCVVFGASDTPVTTFDADRFRIGGTSLYGLALAYEFQHELPGVGLARLAQLIAEHKLDGAIEIEEPWNKVAEVAAGLIERRFTGKAVLYL